MWMEVNWRVISYEELIEALRSQGIDVVYERLLDLYYTEPLIIIGESMKYSPWDEEELYRFLEITYAFHVYMDNDDKEEEL